MSWNLEWYYFGDLVTFVAGGAPCSNPAIEQAAELVNTMLAMCTSNKAELLRILNGETAAGELKLFAKTRELPSIKRRKQPGGKYPWKEWDRNSTIDLRICPISGLKSQALVEPDKIILPWPFPIINGDKLSERIPEFKPDPCIYDPNLHFQINPCMGFIDDLVLHDETREGKEYRKKFIESTAPDHSRQILLDYTEVKQGVAIKLPASVHVIVDKSVPPNKTSIVSVGKSIRLIVGVAGVSIEGIITDPTLFEKWPCGAFERNQGL